MKTSQMTTGNGYLFRACYSKSQTPSLIFNRDEEAERGEEKLYNERRKGFRCSVLESYWHVEAGDGLTKSEIFCEGS